jgi:arabinofuranosyltransferase
VTTRRGLGIACVIAAAATLVAWLVRWGCDDAFISFVYARSLVHGHGLTWFGTQVEGYTNFAWVLWSALGQKLGLPPLGWAWAASLAALAVAVITTYRIGALRRSPLAGLAASGVLATNFTFLAYGTSGLETMLQTALLASALLEVERMRRSEAAPSAESAAVLSLIAALALWTRLDSAPMLAVLAVVAAHRLATTQASVRTWIAAIMPAFVMVGGWFLWKLATYGDVLPNTYYAKAGSGSVAHGAVYVWTFARTYVLWPFLAGIVALAIVRRTAAKLPLALVGAQIAYVIAVGGDFMEFRFLVPALPPLALAIAELVTTPSRIKPALQVGVAIAFLAAFSLRHAATYDGESDFTVDSVRNMSTFYNKVTDNDWGVLGAALRVDLWPLRPAIASDGAGAIPYYADFPTIDQLGLNDEWVARHGDHAPEGYLRPGHQRFATLDYLRRRNVTFVIGQPILVERGALALRRHGKTVTLWLGTILGPNQSYTGPFDVVAAPIDDEHELLMWYLTPDPATSARIAGWDHVRLRGR